MKRSLFRQQPDNGSVLAIDPKALGFSFFMGGSAENEICNGVAIVHIEGPLEHKSTWCWDSYESIIERVREAAEDEDSTAVILKIDSPGGDVDGLNEAVSEIVRIKEGCEKPFYAYANELAASAAYALACSCDEIYLPEAGGVGSIGVISVLCEMTKRDRKEGYTFEIIASGERKPDGNPHVEISDGARKRVRKRIDTLAGMFFDLVAESRGLTPEAVEGYEADVFYGPDAVTKKLADGVLSFPDMLETASGAINSLDTNGNVGSRVKSDPARGTGNSKRGSTMGILALRKRKTEAAQALRTAKTEAAKKAAGAEFKAACVALAEAEALVEAKKMKKTKYVEETEETDEEDDSEEDDEDDEEDEDDADDADDDGDDDGDDDDDDDGDDAEDEADEKKAAAALYRDLSRATGKRGRGAIMGMVQAALDSHKHVAKLSTEMRSMKVDKMISEGRKSGKIEKSLVAFCRDMGMRSPKQLKTYLEQKSPSVRTTDEAPRLPREFAAAVAEAGVSLTPEQGAIARTMGMDPDAIKRVAAMTNGSGTPKR